MSTRNKLAAVAVVAIAGILGVTLVSAKNIRPGKLTHGQPIVIGFIGCDMHAEFGPEVTLVQVVEERTKEDPVRLLGMPCADALVIVQKRGLRLGQSRVIPGAAASGDPDCLAWEIVASSTGQ